MNLSRHHGLYATAAAIARPLLMSAWKLKRKVNKMAE